MECLPFSVPVSLRESWPVDAMFLHHQLNPPSGKKSFQQPIGSIDRDLSAQRIICMCKQCYGIIHTFSIESVNKRKCISHLFAGMALCFTFVNSWYLLFSPVNVTTAISLILSAIQLQRVENQTNQNVNAISCSPINSSDQSTKPNNFARCPTSNMSQWNKISSHCFENGLLLHRILGTT